MGTGSNAEIEIGLSYAHLSKEYIRKPFVIVLTGMNEYRLDFRVPAHLAKQWRHFDEIRPRANDIKDLHLASPDGSYREYIISRIIARLHVSGSAILSWHKNVHSVNSTSLGY